MIRLAIALVCCAALPALETPLIINAPDGTQTVTINPTLGTMTMYQILDGALTRKGSANFLNDVAFLERYVIGEQDGDVITTLRTGLPNNSPTPADWMAKILGSLKSPKAQAEAGVISLLSRAINAEKEFWSKEHAYDGVVRAAMSTQYLMVVVPCKHALLFYDTANEGFRLIGATNFGPLLYLPHVYNSNPVPQDIVKQLPQDVQQDRRDALEKQLEDLLAKSEQAIALQPCDVWVAADNADKFIVVDLANKHLMSFEYAGKVLKVNAVRNIEVDLMIPTSFNSTPDTQGLYDEFRKDKSRRAWAESLGVTDLISFQVYVEGQQAGAGGQGKASTVQLNVITDTGDLTIDFGDQRKVAVYRFGGGNTTLDLKSLRDYTLDAGLSLLEAKYNDIGYAAQFLDAGRKAKNDAIAMQLIRSALSLNPLLYKDVEGDRRLVKAIGALPDYQAMIEKATQEAKALEDGIKRRIEESQRRRDEKKKDGG